MKSEYITALIVSDSTNTGMADVEMKKNRYTVPSFSGRIVEVREQDKDIPATSADDVPVYLAYKNSDNEYVRFTNDEAVTYTTGLQVGTDYSPYYTHGNFSGLGGGNMKYALSDYPEVYVVFESEVEKVAGPYPINGVSSYRLNETDFN